MLPPKAYLFIGLNVARALSLITLILVFSSSIVVMSKDVAAIRKGPAGLPNHNDTISINGTSYYFECDYLDNSTVPIQPGGSMFAIINHLFIIFQVILLFLSEICWPSRFLDEFVPVLGTEHGVGILGFMQIFIGAAVLSHHVDTFALVSAFFLFAIGCLNVLLGLTFRSSIKTKRSLTSWRERVPDLPRSTSDFKTAVSSNNGPGVFNVANTVFTNVTGGSRSEKNQEPGAYSGYGFGRQGEKNAGLKGFLISKPVESLPRYAPQRHTPSRNSSRSSKSSASDIPIQDPPKSNRI